VDGKTLTANNALEMIEIRINCKHFYISRLGNGVCNSPKMPKIFGLFRKKCVTWYDLEKCEFQEKIQ